MRLFNLLFKLKGVLNDLIRKVLFAGLALLWWSRCLGQKIKLLIWVRCYYMTLLEYMNVRVKVIRISEYRVSIRASVEDES